MIDVAGVFTGKRDCDGAGLGALGGVSGLGWGAGVRAGLGWRRWGGVRAGLAALCGHVVRGEHAESAVVRGWDAG